VTLLHGLKLHNRVVKSAGLLIHVSKQIGPLRLARPKPCGVQIRRFSAVEEFVGMKELRQRAICRCEFSGPCAPRDGILNAALGGLQLLDDSRFDLVKPRKRNRLKAGARRRQGGVLTTPGKGRRHG
jgi:hypothetical protein